MHAEAWRYVRRIQDNATQFVMQACANYFSSSLLCKILMILEKKIFQGNYLPSTYFSSASTDRQKKSAPGLEEMASNQAVHKGSLFFNEWSPL